MCIGHQVFLLRIEYFTFLNLTIKESIASLSNLRNYADINFFRIILNIRRTGRFSNESTTTRKNTIQ